jgi:hypothetical protein
VVKNARIVCGLAAATWAIACLPALAQRVQFPTPLGSQQAASAPGAPAVTYQPATPYVQPLTPSPYPTPSLSPPAATPGATLGFPTTPSLSPTYTPPPSYTAPPPATPGAVVQPPPATWDPYATPGNTPSALLPQDPYFQSSGPPAAVTSMQKFVQHVDLDYHWFAGHNGAVNHQELGINDVELSVTFAFPMFHNSQTPLLITPGFAVHYWEGPLSVPPPIPPPDLPPRTYDAYLDAAWNPQITPWLGGELDGRIGVYSDFYRVANDSIRFTGKGMAVLTMSPSVKVKLGVWYLNRNVVKLLPAGGICWTPNPDIYFDILFPNPKVGKRLTTWGNTDWWIYFAGDYGGGKWAIRRQNGISPNPFIPDTNGTFDTFDYNDIRVAVGLEFNTLRHLHGMFEVGGAFDREVIYQSGQPHAYYPNNTVFLRAGLAY